MNDQIDHAVVMELCRRYNRWGRWGEDDERGTLNFIDEAAVLAATRLVKRGETISCALPFGEDGPQTGSFGRTNPLHFMLQHGGDIALGAQDHLGELRYTDDAIYMPLQCGTQWDALSHIFHEGKMWNGYGLECVTSRGATRNAITAAADRLVGRGVLLDVPRFRGVPWVEPGEQIDGDELAACAEHEGVSLQRGDIVLVRTGQISQVRERGFWGEYAAGTAPGLGVMAAPWLCENEVAAVATDTWGIEVLPNQTPDVFQPLHLIMLVNAGILIGEMFDLEALALSCATDGRYAFLFVAVPIPFTGAVGSPVNPIAVK